MAQIPGRERGGIDALTAGNASSAKVPIPFEPGLGCKLANGTDYYFPISDSDSKCEHVTLKWDGNAIVTWTFESTSIPVKKDLDDAFDLKDWDNTAGNGWNQENPSTAYISVLDTTGASGNATVASMTITVTGGLAGSASVHIGNLGSKRLRVKAHMGGTGGFCRVSPHGKS